MIYGFKSDKDYECTLAIHKALRAIGQLPVYTHFNTIEPDAGCDEWVDDVSGVSHYVFLKYETAKTPEELSTISATVAQTIAVTELSPDAITAA